MWIATIASSDEVVVIDNGSKDDFGEVLSHSKGRFASSLLRILE